MPCRWAATPTATTSYCADGKRIALAVNGSFYYLGSDGVGSATVALDSTGNVQSSVLYGPYGTTRYSSGTMPGSYGYTGQHADATTGLPKHKAELVSTALRALVAPVVVTALIAVMRPNKALAYAAHATLVVYLRPPRWCLLWLSHFGKVDRSLERTPRGTPNEGAS